jgi:hypothetical protein
VSFFVVGGASNQADGEGRESNRSFAGFTVKRELDVGWQRNRLADRRVFELLLVLACLMHFYVPDSVTGKRCLEASRRLP